MDNKILGGILILLLGIYGASLLFSGKTERSFKAEIIEVDPAEVTSLKIYNKADDMQEVLLQKENDNWKLSKGALTVVADTVNVNAMLNQLKLVKANRIATKKKEKWVDYEVEEGKANRVKVFSGNKLLSDMTLGRFQFNQQTKSGVSYLRVGDADNVYAVDGFLSMSLGQGFDSFRNKKLIALNKDQITGVSVTSEKGSFTLSKTDGTWQTAEGVVLDSTKTVNYINALSSLNGSDFSDEINEAGLSALPTQSLAIQTSEKPTAVMVNCYFKEGGEKPYIIKSSENDAFFVSDEKGLPSRIFKPLTDLTP